MKRSRKLKVGISGNGVLCEPAAAACMSVSEADFVAYCDRDTEAGARRAKGWGVPLYSTLPEMLDRAKLDVLVELSTPENRVEEVVEAIKRNVHVALYKPLASDLADASRILEAGGTGSGRVFVVDPLCGNPAVRQARDLIKRGRIGEVQTVRLRMWAGGLGGRGLGFDPDRVGEHGWNPALHPAFESLLLLGMLGGPMKQVHAVSDRLPMTLLMKYEREGLFGMAEFAFSPQMFVPSDAFSMDAGLEIAGTDGILWIENLMGRMRERPSLMIKRKSETVVPDQDFQQGFAAGMQASLSDCFGSILHRKRPECTTEQAWEALRAGIAVKESIASRSPVMVSGIAQAGT